MNGRGREYASALMELAIAERLKDQMYESLVLVRDVFKETPEYEELLISPAVPSEERVELVKKAFEGSVHDYILSFLCVLTMKGHIKDFKEAFDSFEEMYLELSKRTEAVVTTAVELSTEQKYAMKAALEKRLGKTVDITFQINRKLIGGAVVEADGQRLDGSLRHRLRDIKEVMEQ
ncbi:MAG: ATP synthase F1 subunit delta [Clostridiales bacterium]|nr:ATP synthase F1 subunit delta [Clostridiales bacterium]